jgi:hypothetical protein
MGFLIHNTVPSNKFGIREAVIYIFYLLMVGNRRLNTCTVLSNVSAVPLAQYFRLHNLNLLS